MKTAISLPDSLFEDVDEIANDMGIPRSQLFAKALEEYIIHHKRNRITDRLNSVYSEEVDPDPSSSLVGIESLRNLTQNDTW